jgi:hypothetical protein
MRQLGILVEGGRRLGIPTADNESSLRVVLQQPEVLRTGDVPAEPGRLGCEGVFVLAIQRQGQDVPRVKRLIVHGRQRERGHLAPWGISVRQ